MTYTLRHPLAAVLVFVAVFVGVFYFMERSDDGANDSQLILGDWTDPAGEPGNFIRFGTKNVTPPNNPVPFMELHEGRAVFHKHLGQENTTVTWNYENFKALRVNVTVPGRCNFASIRMVGPDRMLVRFTKTIDEAAADDVLEGPDVKALVRVRGADAVRE